MDGEEMETIMMGTGQTGIVPGSPQSAVLGSGNSVLGTVERVPIPVLCTMTHDS
jgi:hypothetical protein